MKKINDYIQEHYNGDACDFYRHLVKWMDYRNEHQNQGKTLKKLADEFILELEN